MAHVAVEAAAKAAAEAAAAAATTPPASRENHTLREWQQNLRSPRGAARRRKTSAARHPTY